MGSIKVPKLSISRRERIALEALRGSEPYIQGERLDIERILIEFKGFQIESFGNLKRDFDALGLSMASRKTIFIDAELLDSDSLVDQRRYRFTLSEEWAHTLIHGDLLATCKTFDERIALNHELEEADAALLEMQAKALAGAILMPKERMYMWLKERGFTFEMEGMVKIGANIVGQAAIDYDVSELAVIKRVGLLCQMNSMGIL